MKVAATLTALVLLTPIRAEADSTVMPGAPSSSITRSRLQPVRAGRSMSARDQSLPDSGACNHFCCENGC
jgi:hypothetical protein